MQVKSIDNNFQSSFLGNKFLNEKSISHVKSILHRMNADTIYTSTEKTFSSKIISKVGLNDKSVSVVDERFLLRPVDYNRQMQGRSLLSIGKIDLEIDNTNGEIIKNSKPFFIPWFMVLKPLEKALKTIRMNFNNASVVTKTTLEIGGFTQKGVLELNKASEKVSYNRLI